MFQTQMQASNLPAQDRLATITDAFPKRRMAILASGKQGMLLSLLFALLSLVIMGVLLYTSVPDLIYDYKVSQDPVVDTQAEIHGSCKTRKAIFVDCDVTIKYRPAPQDTATKEIKHSFGFVSFNPSMTTDAVRSKKDPGMITTSIATEHILNRFFTTLGTTLLFGFLFFACCHSAWATRNFNRLAKTKPILQPQLVKVTQIQNNRTVSFETYIDGSKKKLNNLMRKKSSPLYLPNNDNTALAVTITGSDHVILLDEQLTVLDFTEQERVALRAAMVA